MHAFRFRSLIATLTLALIGTTALSSFAFGEDVNWTDGNLSSAWSDAGNWEVVNSPGTNRVPTAADIAVLRDFGLTIDLRSGSQSPGGIRFAGSGVRIGTGVLNLSGGDAMQILADLSGTLNPDTTTNFGVGSIVEVQRGGSLNARGTINALTGFTKTGQGVLTLNGLVNGAVTVSDGTLDLGYDSSNFSGGQVSGRVDLGPDGRLVSSGDFTRRVGSVSGSGELVVDATLVVGSDDTSSTFSGVISGVSDLFKVGVGTFTLTGDSTSAVRMIVANGVLSLGDGGTAGSLGGDIQVQSGTELVLNRSDSYQLANPLDGTGTLRKKGSSLADITSQSNQFRGNTLIEAGTLQVTGSLMSAVSVNGGTLSGTGTLASVTVASGGTMAPGTMGGAPGTLTVLDDVVFDAGSFFDVDVMDDGQADELVAANVDIQGGTVQVHLVPGSYVNTMTYNIISANSITGAFDGTTIDNLAFLSATTVTQGNTVELRVQRRTVPPVVTPPVVTPPVVTPPVVTPPTPVAFNSVARTQNQFEAANGIASVGGSALYNAIMVQTTAGAQKAFSLLSSEPFASQSGVFQQASAAQRVAALDRARQGSNAITHDGAVMSYLDDGKGQALSAGDRTVWGGVYGNRGTLDGNTNAAEITSGSGGFQAGADDWFGDFRLGVMINAGRTSMSVADRNFSSDSNDYGIGIYGGTQFGATSIAVGAAYERHDVTSTRIVAFPGFNETLDSAYAAGTGQLFGEISHRFDVGPVTVSPYAQLAYVNTRTDGFAETGGASALTVAGRTEDSLSTSLGARIEGDFVLGNDMVVKASGALGWRHAFADDPTSTASFAGGQSFSATGSPIAKDALVVEAGLKMDIATNVSLALNYGGQFASTGNDQNLSAKLAVRF